MGRLERLANWCVLLTGWKRYLVAFGAGLASALAMPPFDLVFVLFVTLPVMVWIMDGAYGDGHQTFPARIRAAFLPGWWFGFGYFIAGLWWLGNAFLIEADIFVWAMPLAVAGLPAFLAIFFGVSTIIARLLWSDGAMRLFAFAAALSAMEFARGHVLTGFPWNTLGYAALFHSVLMQSVSLIGLYGMTIMAILVFTAPLVLLASPVAGRTRKTWLALSGLLIMAQVGYGAGRMITNQTDYVDGVDIRIMQPNINQRKKFNPENEDEIIRTYLELSASLEGEEQTNLENTDWLVWPESAFPFLLTERREVLGAIGELLPPGTRLVTGAMRAEPGAGGDPYGKVYNSVLLIEENGEISAAADKTHLVPFGEYLPFQPTLESIGLQQLTRMRGGFEAGSSRRLLALDTDHPFLPLVCYEIIFSGQIRNPYSGAEAEPKWIVNLTNDAWFGFTPGPYQHLRQSMVRAVEEGLPVVRVANTGVSAVIDAYGRMKARIPLGERGVRDSGLPTPTATPTLFSRYGHTIFFAMLVFALLLAVAGKADRRRK